MSFSEILMKLAEKKALEGDVNMAYSLMSEVEKKDDHESIAEMLKNGKEKDAYSSTLNSMINKYASEGGKGSYKNKIKSMDGFMKMDGKAFCFTNNAQAKKALAVVEQAANFLNWQVMKGDGCFKLMEVGMDKNSSALKNLIKKYAGFDDYDVPESGTTIEEMYDEDPSENYEDKDNIITDGFYAGLKNMDNNPHVENSYEHTMWQMGFEAGKEISDHFEIISEK